MSTPDPRAWLIGIDPGVSTGFALWSRVDRKLVRVSTLAIHQAMLQVLERADGCKVVMEDARLRTWFGKSSREVLQGAGSIKRDCSIWEAFCADYGIPLAMVRPQKGATKWPADRFAKVTGWTERTSEHARDAALLVFGGL